MAKNTKNSVSEEAKNRLSRLDQKINEEIEKELPEIVAYEIGRQVRQRTGSNEINRPRSFGQIFYTGINQILTKENFRLCWRGTCRNILIIAVLSYLVIGILMFSCRLFGFTSFCASRSFFGANIAILFVAVISLLATLIYSIFSNQRGAAIFVGLLLEIPLMVVILILISSYLGLIIVGLVIFIRFIQGMRHRYL